MQITTPAIGKLLGRSRIWAHLAVKAGKFGLVTKRGRADLVALAHVERVTGRRFTLAQLAAVGLHPQEDHHGTDAAPRDGRDDEAWSDFPRTVEPPASTAI